MVGGRRELHIACSSSSIFPRVDYMLSVVFWLRSVDGNFTMILHHENRQQNTLSGANKQEHSDLGTNNLVPHVGTQSMDSGRLEAPYASRPT